jgi:lipopolysaccharide export system permease protein
MTSEKPLKIGLIDRYLLVRYLSPFGYCLAAFLLVMFIYDFSINLEDFIDGKVRLDIILEYFAYSIPIKIVDVLPMASLLSIMYAIGQLKKHNEIIAFQASGISLHRLMAPLLCLGFLISLVVLVINETIVPSCRQRVAKLETVYMKKNDVAKVGAVPTIFAFYNLQDNRSWVGIIDPSKKLIARVEIREFDKDDNVLRKIAARQANWTEEGWKLTDGKTIHYVGGSLGPEEIHVFKEEGFAFSEKFRDLLDSQKDPIFMNLRELQDHIKVHPKYSRVYHEENVEFYHKTAFPFLNFVVMLLGVPIGLKTEKGNFFIGLGIGLGLFLTYYGVNLMSLVLAKNEAIPAWLGGWFSNLLCAGIGLELIRRTR